MGKLKDKVVGFAGFASVLGLGMVIGNNPTLKAHAGNFALYMRANPAKGAVIHATLSTLITVSGVPFSLVDLGAAWVYPMPVALCMLLFAKTLGSALCYLIAKTVLPDARAKSILAHPTVARVDRMLTSSPVYYGTLFRLCLMPAFVKNYGLALLNISFSKYITCCLLGSSLGVPAQTYLGSQLGDFYLGFKDAEDLAKGDPMVLLGGLVPVLAMIVMMPAIAKVLLGKDEDSAPGRKEWKVVLEKADADGSPGLELAAHGALLRVEAVKPGGAAAAWNEKTPDEAVASGDLVKAVNGVRGNPDVMLVKVKEDARVELLLERSPPSQQEPKDDSASRKAD